MQFAEVMAKYQDFDFEKFWSEVTPAAVQIVLAKNRLSASDLLVLLAPSAVSQLESMAQKAVKLKEQHFGKTIQIYTPLYLANYCANECIYCGFNCKNQIARKKLTPAEIENEAKAIAASGIQHLLLLTGEAPAQTPVSYLKEAVAICAKYFASVALEVFPMETAEYSELISAGADSLTIYQEVYDAELYPKLHLKGPKSNYLYRLGTPERGAKAGFRAINIGALLGLGDKRKEAFFTALHAEYLEKEFPGIDISLSTPRMRPAEGGFQPLEIVTDLDLVQFILAFRLFLPRAGMTVSTREGADLRDKLMHLGITRLSAGSKTTVGGYAEEDETTGQFNIEDNRSIEELCTVIRQKGLLPVFKDWEQVN